LIPGSRKQKALSEEELEQIASVYQEFKKSKKARMSSPALRRLLFCCG
jgi:hypothetical protein